MTNVLIDQSIMQMWAETVREKTGTEEFMTPATLLWKTQTEWGSGESGDGGINLIDYMISYSFRGVKFSESTVFKSKPKVSLNYNLSNAFRSTTNLTNIEIDYDFGDTEYVFGYFADASNQLEYVDFKGDTIRLTGSNACIFNLCSLLKEINAVFDFTNVTSTTNAFNYCFELEEVRFVSGSILKSISFSNSAKLSDLSIQSIIDGLADLTGGTAQTLTFHADVKAKLTNEQLETITSKNWTLA